MGALAVTQPTQSEPRETPILFSGPMVRAILADRKTQTRRIVKPRGGCSLFDGSWTDDYILNPGNDEWRLRDLRWNIGDRLWVREAFGAFGFWQTQYSEIKHRDIWSFIDLTVERGWEYRFDIAEVSGARRSLIVPEWHRRPSIFMPRVASRITLEVTAVRVERLQNISEEDAIAEGIGAMGQGGFGIYGDKNIWEATPRYAYAALWSHINGDASWSANPWVSVTTFRRVGRQQQVEDNV